MTTADGHEPVVAQGDPLGRDHADVPADPSPPLSDLVPTSANSALGHSSSDTPLPSIPSPSPVPSSAPQMTPSSIPAAARSSADDATTHAAPSSSTDLPAEATRPALQHNMSEAVPMDVLVPVPVPVAVGPSTEEAGSTLPDLEGPQIRAFAKLEFDDGPFYMNTYSVELGRDVRAAKLAFRKEPGKESAPVSPQRRSSSIGDVPQTPLRGRRDEGGRISGSVVSESGGIMGVDTSDHEGLVRKRRSRRGSKKSKSTTSSSQQLSRQNSTAVTHANASANASAQTDYQSLALQSLAHTRPLDYPLDPLSLLPSPDECPLIPIHPPASAIETGGHKGISRKHVKIAFNFEKHLFELHIGGRNGAFVEDRWHAAGEVIPLKNGSHIQIGGVSLRFSLPDVAEGATGAEAVNAYREREANPVFDEEYYTMDMAYHDHSLDDEGGIDARLTSGSDEDEEFGAGYDQDLVGAPVDEEGEDGDEDDDDEEDEDDEGEEEEEEEGEEEEEEEEEVEATPPPPPPPPPVKRGPGRPPKNGIMSKRQQQLLAREAREAKKLDKDATVPPVKVKGKVGRPRKHPKPESPTIKPEKRKYTKRKGMDGAGASKGKENQNGGKGPSSDSAPPKEKKEKKAAKPPRSPSPVFDESKLTAEELAKPQASYVVLIHEALSHSKTGAMSLPQIYRAIERKYPFYKLRVTTTGWQSSVRHNLSQHHAFQKVERDGKGWMWGLVPGVSIEKEKKRRASPPPHPPQPYPASARPGAMPLAHHGMVPASYGAPNRSMGPPPPQAMPARAAGAGVGPLGAAQAGPGLSSFPAARAPNGYQSPYATASTNPQAVRSVNPAIQSRLPPPPPSHLTAAAAQPRTSDASIALPPLARPTTTPSSSSSSSQPARAGPALNAEIIQAVQNFKTALIKSIPPSKMASSEAIVQSAVNRALGLSDKTSLPNGREDPQEATIMKALATIIGGVTGRAPSKTAAPPVRTPQPAPPKPAPPAAAPPANAPSQLLQYLAKVSKNPPRATSTPTPTPGSGAPTNGAGVANPSEADTKAGQAPPPPNDGANSSPPSQPVVVTVAGIKRARDAEADGVKTEHRGFDGTKDQPKETPPRAVKRSRLDNSNGHERGSNRVVSVVDAR
ncbi:MAG: hypothetical protein M1838_004958 [Thelocarpon superellum]|nr:MAG: hypothetical protein M1838_004958 [Thelocarpon superellum]